MDLVVPLGPGSRHNNIELRYALRSFELYLPHDRVIIVGERPEWLQNITHIPFPHKPCFENRVQNIYNKIMAAFEITDKMIFCNDDHFILQPIEEMPYHHKGLMTGWKADSYGRLLLNTLQAYPDCLNFDTHCPIIYERGKMPAINSTVIKSSYCVHNKIIGSFYPDCKISRPMSETKIWSLITGRMYFSIGDLSFGGGIEKVLQSLYPNKSKYEK
jgi:hypothetical protein